MVGAATKAVVERGLALAGCRGQFLIDGETSGSATSLAPQVLRHAVEATEAATASGVSTKVGVLLMCGVKHRKEVPNALEAAGIKCIRTHCYRSIPCSPALVREQFNAALLACKAPTDSEVIPAEDGIDALMRPASSSQIEPPAALPTLEHSCVTASASDKGIKPESNLVAVCIFSPSGVRVALEAGILPTTCERSTSTSTSDPAIASHGGSERPGTETWTKPELGPLPASVGSAAVD